MLKNYLLSPLCSASASHLSLFQPSFSFSFSASFFFSSLLVSAFLFLFSFPAPPLFLLFVFLLYSFVFSASFFSCRRVTPFFQPKNIFFSPKTFFSSAQNVFASAQNLFQFSPKPFSAQNACLWFSASFFSSFSAPLFFLLTCCPFLLLLFSLHL